MPYCYRHHSHTNLLLPSNATLWAGGDRAARYCHVPLPYHTYLPRHFHPYTPKTCRVTTHLCLQFLPTYGGRRVCRVDAFAASFSAHIRGWLSNWALTVDVFIHVTICVSVTL